MDLRCSARSDRGIEPAARCPGAQAEELKRTGQLKTFSHVFQTPDYGPFFTFSYHPHGHATCYSTCMAAWPDACQCQRHRDRDDEPMPVGYVRVRSVCSSTTYTTTTRHPALTYTTTAYGPIHLYTAQCSSGTARSFTDQPLHELLLLLFMLLPHRRHRSRDNNRPGTARRPPTTRGAGKFVLCHDTVYLF